MIDSAGRKVVEYNMKSTKNYKRRQRGSKITGWTRNSARAFSMYNTSIPSVSSSGEHVSTEDCCMYSEQG